MAIVTTGNITSFLTETGKTQRFNCYLITHQEMERHWANNGQTLSAVDVKWYKPLIISIVISWKYMTR